MTKEEILLILSRYMYRIGKPIISDSDYDKLEKYIKSNGLLSSYLGRTYDDDPVPVDLLEKYGYKEDIIDFQELYDQLNQEKSFSIFPVQEWAEAYSYFIENKASEFIFMLKSDGNFTKSIYTYAENSVLLQLSLSRGRSGNAFNLTGTMKKFIVNKIDNVYGDIKIYGECLVPVEHLPKLRKLNPDLYKTPKSAAISALRVMHPEEYYQYLKLYTFDVEGLDLNLQSDRLDWLNENGFDTVPYIIVGRASVDLTSLDLFKESIKTHLDLLSEKSLGIPSDGVVVTPNDLTEVSSDIQNQYDKKSIALKLYHWDAEKYTAIIESFLLEQRRVTCCCKAIIEPCVTSDNCSARIVNMHNPGVVIKLGYKPGDKITFEKIAGAYNSLSTEVDWRNIRVNE